jgi:hypothetical protein
LEDGNAWHFDAVPDYVSDVILVSAVLGISFSKVKDFISLYTHRTCIFSHQYTAVGYFLVKRWEN